jgi:hypothetical protein
MSSKVTMCTSGAIMPGGVEVAHGEYQVVGVRSREGESLIKKALDVGKGVVGKSLFRR